MTRTIWYRQVALDYRHELPVLTVLVLLRKEANSPDLVGSYERRMPNGRRTNWFGFEVVRLWKEEPESFLNADVALVPLAPLTDVAEEALPELVRKMAVRINSEPRPQATKLWTATYLLMGLRYPDELISHLLEGAQGMKESTTYQAILREGRNEGIIEGRNEGRLDEARRLLLLLGTKRFGEADATTMATLEAILDIERLETLSERILDVNVNDWNSLLRTP